MGFLDVDRQLLVRLALDAVDDFLGDIQIAIVIDANFRDDIRRVTVAHHSISKFNFTSHFFSFVRSDRFLCPVRPG